MPNDLMICCEQKKDFRGPQGDYTKWVEVSASQVAAVSRDRIRCKHCHGAVRLHRQQVSHDPQDHVEHLSRQDSEHCIGGHYYKGPPPRLSAQPVE